jgi:hypothetical protein
VLCVYSFIGYIENFAVGEAVSSSDNDNFRILALIMLIRPVAIVAGNPKKCGPSEKIYSLKRIKISTLAPAS